MTKRLESLIGSDGPSSMSAWCTVPWLSFFSHLDSLRSESALFLFYPSDFLLFFFNLISLSFDLFEPWILCCLSSCFGVFVYFVSFRMAWMVATVSKILLQKTLLTFSKIWHWGECWSSCIKLSLHHEKHSQSHLYARLLLP